MLAELQRRMAAAVHGDADAFQAALAAVRPAGIAADKRLYLHRGTVRAGLTAVLRQAFPATARVLGERAFQAEVDAYTRAAPPRLAVLSAYGAGFADRLAAGRRDAATETVARLDWAAHRAYFAADAAPLAGEALAGLAPEAQARLCLTPVPSATLLPLDAATWGLWRRHADADELTIADTPAPAAALVWRTPAARVAVRALAAGEAALHERLFAGAHLLEAAAAGAAAEPGFELTAILAAALAGGVFRALDPAARADG